VVEILNEEAPYSPISSTLVLNSSLNQFFTRFLLIILNLKTNI
jgi:hypothetical protein